MKVSYRDPEFDSKLVSTFLEYGVAIVEDVFDKKECDSTMDELVTCLEKLGTGIDRKDLKTWNEKNLPPNLRPGLFHSLVSHFAPIWKIRGDERVRRIFEILYSSIRKKKITEFSCSFDGLNLRPGTIGPYFDAKESKDWAHVDQTIRNKPFLCIQGQAVLTNTTACLRATPQSWKIFETLMDLHNIQDGNYKNWCLVKPEHIKTLQDALKKKHKSTDWQIPILSSAGSFIVWSSSTIHSARLQLESEEPTEKDIWRGWRGVIYVSYRPRHELSKEEQKNKSKLVAENRMTNHWGTKVFDLYAGTTKKKVKHYHPIIQALIKEPATIFEIVGEPKLDASQLALA